MHFRKIFKKMIERPAMISERKAKKKHVFSEKSKKLEEVLKNK